MTSKINFDFEQLLRELQKIQVKLDEGFVDEAEDLLDFVVGEISIRAGQAAQCKHPYGKFVCSKCGEPIPWSHEV
jgi:hypothetical protein